MTTDNNQIMKRSDWLTKAIIATQHAVAKAANHESKTSFHENYITSEALIGLQEIGEEFHWDDNNHGVKWEARKLKGRLEKERGDIVVFVRIQLTKEHHVNGMAYYEAKRQYFSPSGDRVGFKAFDSHQIYRISKHVQAGNIVLYDTEEVNGKVRPRIDAVPIAFVKALIESEPSKTFHEVPGQPKLRDHGRLWVEMLYENLRGYGLDFDEKRVMEMRELVQKQVGPTFVANVTISHRLDLELTLENILGDHYKSMTRAKKIEAEQDRGIEPSGGGGWSR